MMIDRCIHLAYFDPAKGAVPNPGMGINAYVFSDHMHYGYSSEEFSKAERSGVNLKLTRNTFDEMLKLPFVDNLYFRIDWNQIQKQPGKLSFPEEWDWMMEAVETKGKRWSFRIMNANRFNEDMSSVPDFLANRLPMESYINQTPRGVQTRFYPAYTEEYFKWWEELMDMLADSYDDHPLLEFVDVSGYGIWGEGHHYLNKTADSPSLNNHPNNAEEAVTRLINMHTTAFQKTPVVLTLHYLDYKAGVRAVENSDCWVRRDSFQNFSSIYEYDAMAVRKPGRAILWETMLPFFTMKPPIFTRARIPQRYYDIGAHYVAVGFNPWDAIIDHAYFQDMYDSLTQHIGYRIRPSIIWRRINEQNRQELVVALVNDGCVDVPGTITMTATFPGGLIEKVELPIGSPIPGSRDRYTIPMPKESWGCTCEHMVELRLTVRIKGKASPVRWAVRQFLSDPYTLRVPLRTPPDGDPFLTPAGPYHPIL